MADSGIFSGLNGGIRFPDAAWNQGPTPPENVSAGGVPQGGFGTSSKINYNSALLGGIGAYDYGSSDRIANDISYQNIAYRVPKLVPIVTLPGPTESEPWITITHPVDDGDIAFVLRDMPGRTMLDKKSCERYYTEKNCNVFVNLPTLNYILVGIQLYWLQSGQIFVHQVGVPGPPQRWAPQLGLPSTWRTLIDCLGLHIQTDNTYTSLDTLVAAIISNLIVPFGIPHGSEKQGGNHEGVESIVTWATNFVTTMFTDGYVRNMVNIWRGLDCGAGEPLSLGVQRYTQQMLDSGFVLNHYYKATTRKKFNLPDNFLQNMLDDYYINIYILGPFIPDAKFLSSLHVDYITLRNFPHWKIALPYVRHSRYDTSVNTSIDDTAGNRGALLEGVFSPVLVRGITRQRAFAWHDAGPMALASRYLPHLFNGSGSSGISPAQASTLLLSLSQGNIPTLGDVCSTDSIEKNSGMAGMSRYQNGKSGKTGKEPVTPQLASSVPLGTGEKGSGIGSKGGNFTVRMMNDKRNGMNMKRVIGRDGKTYHEACRDTGGDMVVDGQSGTKSVDSPYQKLCDDLHKQFPHVMKMKGVTAYDVVNHFHCIHTGKPPPSKLKQYLNPPIDPLTTVVSSLSGDNARRGGGGGNPGPSIEKNKVKLPMNEVDRYVNHNLNSLFSSNDAMGGDPRAQYHLQQKSIVTKHRDGVVSEVVYRDKFGRQKRNDEGVSVDNINSGMERGMKRYAALVQKERNLMCSNDATEKKLESRASMGVPSENRSRNRPTEDGSSSSAVVNSAAASSRASVIPAPVPAPTNATPVPFPVSLPAAPVTETESEASKTNSKRPKPSNKKQPPVQASIVGDSGSSGTSVANLF